MKRVAGRESGLLDISVEYLNAGSLGEDLSAKSSILRRGKTYDFVHSELKSDERIVAVATGLLFHGKRDALPSGQSFVAKTLVPAPAFELTMFDSDSGFLDEERALRRLLDATPSLDLIFESRGSACFELKVDDVFLSDDGGISDALFMILSDDIAGIAAVSLGYRYLTVKLTVKLFEDIQPGDTLICFAQVDSESEKYCFASGTIFSNERLVCSCSAILSKGTSYQRERS
jgi:acyl-coenzyme A thioesterase PaaI-like protein